MTRPRKRSRSTPKRVKIHAREVEGFFENLRNTTVIVLLGGYYAGPWLRWDNRQAVLFDLPARKFHIFGLTLWPQDFFFLSWLLVMAALLLFFVTAVAGRVWCGYACPQTVWTQVFVWMERADRGHVRPAHQARQGAVVCRKDPAQGRQAGRSG